MSDAASESPAETLAKTASTAYDAALAHSPGNGDVMRNRELVARALKERFGDR